MYPCKLHSNVQTCLDGYMDNWFCSIVKAVTVHNMQLIQRDINFLAKELHTMSVYVFIASIWEN